MSWWPALFGPLAAKAYVSGRQDAGDKGGFVGSFTFVILLIFVIGVFVFITKGRLLKSIIGRTGSYIDNSGA
jgi:asparagine N-glycosylation enzyme membrane subunit Stt3